MAVAGDEDDEDKDGVGSMVLVMMCVSWVILN